MGEESSLFPSPDGKAERASSQRFALDNVVYTYYVVCATISAHRVDPANPRPAKRLPFLHGMTGFGGKGSGLTKPVKWLV